MIVFDDFSSRGESRECGLGGQKSRFHRHPTRPPGVDDCGRGSFPPSHGAYSAIIETRQAWRLLRAKRPAPQDEVGTSKGGKAAAATPTHWQIRHISRIYL